jgi:hypothetical protein
MMIRKTLGDNLMKNTILKTVLVVALTALLIPAAFAQCVSNVPREVDIGQSACIRVCADDFYYPPILLVGDREGPAAMPILILQAGCTAGVTHCNEGCTAVTPPPYPFVLGGDPYFPNNYYGHSDCFDMYLYWVHNNVWALEVYTLCSGCFCLSFDHQLSVAMRSDLSAVAGDHEVTLGWATASEANNDHFDIMRDGVLAGQVTSAGDNTAGHDYTWTDNSAANDVTYTYSLVAVDVNGGREVHGSASAVPGAMKGVVTEYALEQNYPNPFNPSTLIRFDLVEANHVSLKVFNPMGACVATLVNSTVGVGRHEVSFDGRSLPSGLYFYSIKIGDRYSATRKMLLVK